MVTVRQSDLPSQWMMPVIRMARNYQMSQGTNWDMAENPCVSHIYFRRRFHLEVRSENCFSWRTGFIRTGTFCLLLLLYLRACRNKCSIVTHWIHEQHLSRCQGSHTDTRLLARLFLSHIKTLKKIWLRIWMWWLMPVMLTTPVIYEGESLAHGLPGLNRELQATL